jgi:hypothetical protein
MATVKVNLNAGDIKNGTPGDPCMCPVALACTRAGLTGVKVYGKDIELFYNGDFRVYRVSHQVESFVKIYDGEEPGEPTPLEFEIDLDSYWEDAVAP